MAHPPPTLFLVRIGSYENYFLLDEDNKLSANPGQIIHQQDILQTTSQVTLDFTYYLNPSLSFFR